MEYFVVANLAAKSWLVRPCATCTPPLYRAAAPCDIAQLDAVLVSVVFHVAVSCSCNCDSTALGRGGPPLSYL
eukprot:scaffold24698_cov63-Phaeocystis_antarctica.AAC.9